MDGLWYIDKLNEDYDLLWLFCFVLLCLLVDVFFLDVMLYFLGVGGEVIRFCFCVVRREVRLWVCVFGGILLKDDSMFFLFLLLIGDFFFVLSLLWVGVDKFLMFFFCEDFEVVVIWVFVFMFFNWCCSCIVDCNCFCIIWKNNNKGL